MCALCLATSHMHRALVLNFTSCYTASGAPVALGAASQLPQCTATPPCVRGSLGCPAAYVVMKKENPRASQLLSPFCDLILCRAHSEGYNTACLDGSCVRCDGSLKYVRVCPSVDLSRRASWTLLGKDASGHCCELVQEGNMRALLPAVASQVDTYLDHINQARWAHHAIKSGHDHLLEGHHELLEDFSEGYVAQKAKSMMQEHFKHPTFRLLTAVTCSYKRAAGGADGGDVQFEGEFSRGEHAFLSTDPAMEQNARSILCAIEKWIVRTRADGGLVLVVHGSSDNCSAQNKCGFFMVGLNILARKLKVHFHWRFSCPGHGKGEADGWGGVVKHALNKGLLSEAWKGENAAQAVAYLDAKLPTAPSQSKGKQEPQKRTVRTGCPGPLRAGGSLRLPSNKPMPPSYLFVFARSASTMRSRSRISTAAALPRWRQTAGSPAATAFTPSTRASPAPHSPRRAAPVSSRPTTPSTTFSRASGPAAAGPA